MPLLLEFSSILTRTQALAPSPIATTTARQSNVHHIISAVFRAVEVSGVKLNTLRVPGPDNLRCDPDVKARDGVMTVRDSCLESTFGAMLFRSELDIYVNSIRIVLLVLTCCR